MTNEQAIAGVQYLFDLADRAPLPGDAHRQAEKVARELIQFLQPKPGPEQIIIEDDDGAID